MTTLYAAEAADALEVLREAGVAVSFVRTTPGVYDPATDTWTTPATTTVAGYAIRTRGDPDRYRALELIESQAPTLLFAPSTAGQVPEMGMTVTWSATVYTARDVSVFGPDGTGLVFRCVVTA